MDQNLQEVQSKIQSSIEHLKMELSGIRAGRANPGLLENILADAYGTKMKLVELGSISAPQPTLLTVNVWDASLVKAVQDAILEANLGLNASAEGQTVRVPLPPLTEERREEYVKAAHGKGEEAKIAVRQLRNDQRDFWKEEKESGDISEDEFFRREKLLQELVDRANGEVDELVKLKVEDLRQI